MGTPQRPVDVGLLWGWGEGSVSIPIVSSLLCLLCGVCGVGCGRGLKGGGLETWRQSTGKAKRKAHRSRGPRRGASPPGGPAGSPPHPAAAAPLEGGRGTSLADDTVAGEKLGGGASPAWRKMVWDVRVGKESEKGPKSR